MFDERRRAEEQLSRPKEAPGAIPAKIETFGTALPRRRAPISTTYLPPISLACTSCKNMRGNEKRQQMPCCKNALQRCGSREAGSSAYAWPSQKKQELAPKAVDLTTAFQDMDQLLRSLCLDLIEIS